VKVLIVGAGMQGHVITWNLGRNAAVTEILVADYDEARARFVAGQVGAGKATAVFVDASDADSIAKLGEGAKLIVNAVIPEYNISIMRACLELKTNYLDMASGQTRTKTIDEGFLEQMELDDDFKNAGVCALVNSGMDPGVTNTFAANGYEDLDKCFEIRIKDYAIFDSPVPLQVWSQETYYTDCATPPLVFEDGKFVRDVPFGRKELYAFPEPWGIGPCVLHDHEEPSTLPRLLPKKYGDKGLRLVEFKMGMPEEDLAADQAFIATGMASKEEATLRDGTKVRPIDVFVATLPPNPPPDELAKLAAAGEIIDVGVQVVDCVGEKDGKPHTIHYQVIGPDIKRANELIPGATCVSYGTSTPASIHAEFMIEGRITDTGVIAPELLDRSVRDDFLAEMGRREMPVTRKDIRQIN